MKFIIHVLYSIISLLLLVNTFKDPSFTDNFIPISFTNLTLVFFVVLLITKSFFSRSTNFILLTKISSSVTIVSLSAFSLFVILEASNYPNFVFSRFHVHYLTLPLSIVFNFMTSLLVQLNLNKILYKYSYIPLTFILILMLNKGLFYILNQFSSNYSYMSANINASYDEKMTKYWGDNYELMILIRRVVPENGTVVIPPQSEFSTLGNAGLMTYFLHPRIIKSSSYINFDELKAGDYVLVISDSYSGEKITFPFKTLKANTTIYMNREVKGEEKIIDGDFSPDLLPYDSFFGIIEI